MTAQKQSSRQSLPKVRLKKVTVKKSIVELWTVIFNQIIKYQLPNMRPDQISDHKHDIYLFGKLSTKLLGQAANRNSKLIFTKTGQFFFIFFSEASMASEVTVLRNSKLTLPKRKLKKQLSGKQLLIVNRYWAELLFLIKNMMWYDFY